MEKPILFNAQMVAAILNGSKTQTRRIVKSDYTLLESRSTKDWATGLAGNGCYASTPTAEQIQQKASQLAGRLFPFQTEEAGLIAYQCPHGKPGDHLWVRETFMADELMRTTYAADGGDRPPCGWTPSIHMPRWASRISLEITGVRVERLQEISEQDAMSEGAPKYSYERHINQFAPLDHKQGFERIWKAAYSDSSWHSNPWVWVIEFQQHKQQQGKKHG